MNTFKLLVILSITAFFSMNTLTATAAEDKAEMTAAEKKAEEERCIVPAFAKAIGHEETWKKHNGCPTKEEMKNDE